MRIDEEFKSLIPPLTDEERTQLEENIKEHGCRDPLVVWQGTLIDGHNRYEICTRNGIEFKTVGLELADREAVKLWIYKNQLGRRNITPDWFRYCIGKLYKETDKNQGKRNDLTSDQIDTKLQVADRIAAEHGVSSPTVKRAAKFAEEVDANPDLREALFSGKPVMKAKKEIRSNEIQQQRQEIAKKGLVVQPQDRWNVYHDDMTTWTAPRQYDWIITDPPYPKEFLPLWSDLARRSMEWLKDGGLLVAMSGQSYLDEIYVMLSEHLDYYWTAAYLTPGQPTPLRQVNVNTTWKPLLIFSKGKYTGKIFGDVFKSDGNDKDSHKWGQSVSGMVDVVSKLCLPGEWILDPFCGAGTTGIAAVKHGCLFHGVELDEQNVNISKARLSE